MPFHTHRLPNGLQIIGETIPTARSVAVGFFVKAGSRDEISAEAGVSHYLEHMAFKGTPRRTAAEVNQHLPQTEQQQRRQDADQAVAAAGRQTPVLRLVDHTSCSCCGRR